MNKDILFHLFILTFTCYNYVGSCCASNINVDKSLITVFTKYQVSNYLKFEGLSIYEKISTGRKTSIDRNKKIESEGIFKKDDENNDVKNKLNKWVFLGIGLFFGYALSPTINKVLVMSRKRIKSRKKVSVKFSCGSQVSENIKIDTPQLIDFEWLIVYTSQIGKSHLDSNPQLPCQDSHSVKSLQNGWGIAISCDGAGSAKLSQEGSKFISEEALKLFESIIFDNNWIHKNKLPSKVDWGILAKRELKKLRYDLEQFSKVKNFDFKDLACTIIVVIYSPIGLLTTHIGDGRAGYRNKERIWKAILTPHKGEEANQTIFITSDHWLNDGFVLSGVNVPESNVIYDIPTAFTLMSDGCEAHSFETGYFNKEKEKFIEQNNPYPKFFDPIVQSLLDMEKSGLSIKLINIKWSKFVQSGTEKLKNEPDDKTLILGVLKV